MFKVLIIDDDVDFLLEAQGLFPRETEWLATTDRQKIKELTNMTLFDCIISRKKNDMLLKEIVSDGVLLDAAQQVKSMRKLVLLPDHSWRRKMKQNVPGKQ